MEFKFETGKTYNVCYPSAPFPYCATFVAVGQETEIGIFFEFVLNKERIRISFDDLDKGKLLIKSIESKKQAEKIDMTPKFDWLSQSIEGSSEQMKELLAKQAKGKKDKIAVHPDRYLHTARDAAIKMKDIC